MSVGRTMEIQSVALGSTTREPAMHNYVSKHLIPWRRETGPSQRRATLLWRRDCNEAGPLLQTGRSCGVENDSPRRLLYRQVAPTELRMTRRALCSTDRSLLRS